VSVANACDGAAPGVPDAVAASSEDRFAGCITEGTAAATGGGPAACIANGSAPASPYAAGIAAGSIPTPPSSSIGARGRAKNGTIGSGIASGIGAPPLQSSSQGFAI